MPHRPGTQGRNVATVSTAVVLPAASLPRLERAGSFVEEQRVCLVIEDDPDIPGLITAVLAGAGFAADCPERV